MCDVLIGKEIIHGGSHCKVICPSMDNKLVEEVHGVDFFGVELACSIL